MKRRLLISLAIASLAFSGVAMAEETTVVSTETEVSDIVAQKQAKKAAWEAKQEELKAQREALREERKKAWEAKQEELKAKREALQFERKQAIEKRQEELKMQKEEREKKKQEMIAEKCAKIQEKIASKNKNIEGAKEKHMSVYVNMKNRISKFVEKFKSQGYDTAKLEADLKILEQKIEKFKTDYSAQQAKLSATKELACGHSDGEFKEKLVESRKEAQVVKQDAMDIRKFVNGVIRADIKALQNQKAKTETVETGTKTPETEEEVK